MLRIDQVPSQNGYGVSLPNAARRMLLRGGLPRARLDLIGSEHTAQVSWAANHETYPAFVAFFDRIEFTGEPFKVMLQIGDFTVREHTCRLVPGSVGHEPEGSARFRVSARLFVDPLTSVYDSAGDNSLMDTYELYGEDIGDVLQALAELVNEELPGA